MKEVPNPTPERPAEQEHLQELGAQFAADIPEVLRLKHAIIERAMGSEAYGIYPNNPAFRTVSASSTNNMKVLSE